MIKRRSKAKNNPFAGGFGGTGGFSNSGKSNNMIDDSKNMDFAPLSYKKRQRLPDSAFAIVKTVNGRKIRKYPVNDIAHARNALARVSAYGTPQEKAQVRKVVYKKYPQLNPKNKK